MSSIIETFIARAWNSLAVGRTRQVPNDGLVLGSAVVSGEVSRTYVRLPHSKRPEHVAILGKTGTGKSSLLEYMTVQDIREGRGFVHFDLHGNTTPYLLGQIALEERRRGSELSERLIVIEPGDPEYSVGLNVLEPRQGRQSFVQIAEFAQILKQRWHLDAFGARTEELLRNSLHALSDNNLTLLELAPLLINSAFRASCFPRISNPEVRSYFETRYDQATEAMQAVLRDAILNKVSAFTSDPSFRHILGQSRSSFSLVEALDQGLWIILNLSKGRLGEQASTLGSLFLSQLKYALFSRGSRDLVTLYCDELQNLVTYGGDLDVLFSEARKFGTSLCTANQHMDQYPAQMRSAVLSAGSHVLFQLSGSDAEKLGAVFAGGKSLTELLKNLPPRNFVLKSGHERWRQGVVPELPQPSADYADLYNRCRLRWARRRTEVEQEIRGRQVHATRSSNEVLHDWD